MVKDYLGATFLSWGQPSDGNGDIIRLLCIVHGVEKFVHVDLQHFKDCWKIFSRSRIFLWLSLSHAAIPN